MRITMTILAAGLLCALAEGISARAEPMLDVMEQELHRIMGGLEGEPEPPYYLSFEITENHSLDLRASFGHINQRNEDRTRLLDVDLRVGEHRLDNTHRLSGLGIASSISFVRMPLDQNPEAIRSKLWFQTDRKYKQALERLTRIRTDVRIKVGTEDASGDLSREEPVQYLGERVALELDRDLWEEKLRRYSAPFAAYDEIYQAQAYLEARVETRWYVNSEGFRIRISQPYYRLMISAFSKADDGMELPLSESFFSTRAAGLPAEETILAVVGEMIDDLLKLREAPVVGPYVGPAILSGRASGVFFHEIFGHRVEGHRQKDEQEGQTFKDKIGQPLLPATFSVYFDPLLATYAGTELAGHYLYDNQGVAARRVTVVQDGIFRSFLVSRSPIAGFGQSNGHGRKQAGFTPVARQSNLVVEVTDGVSPTVLKQRLLELVRAQDKPWGLRFEDVQGGFTLTGRTIPNAFNVLPLMVFRVYVDGREELVRGVDLIGTPLQAFSKIVAADNQIGVFNGICGAESGSVPVAAVSPGLLISQIEVQKKHKSQQTAPILSSPLRRERSRGGK